MVGGGTAGVVGLREVWPLGEGDETEGEEGEEGKKYDWYKANNIL